MMRYFILLALAAAFVAAGPVQYTYDEAGRLTSVDYGNGRTINYSYDKSGNLLARTVTGSSASTPKIAAKDKSRRGAPLPFAKYSKEPTPKD